VLAGVRAHPSRSGTGPFTSHEALVLDYERPQVRHDPVSGDDHLTSTHLPWIGDRTAAPGQAHVALLARVANPVACKVGPTATPDRLRRLCALLDPDRSPGRLTLVSRMGRDRVRTLLAPLVAAVRDAGHPVVWLCDPMHGNTVRTPDGTKTRMLADVVAEVRAFGEVLAAAGLHAGGLHLETAATTVTECVGADVPGPGALAARYESPCDPRLNPAQARAVIAAC
jgi:3-deoxy-7-phosphoheptulonate synthase